MSTKKESLDYFGQFLMKYFRDRTLMTLENAMKKKWEGGSFTEFQEFLQTLTEHQKKIIFSGFREMIHGALHDLLFGLQEENHFTGRIKILVDEYDVVQISDGIHGEQYSKDGWIEKFSTYKN